GGRALRGGGADHRVLPDADGRRPGRPRAGGPAVSAHLAIVSGGTRGIGLALSRRLLQMGHTVLALYRSDDVAAEKARADLDGLLVGRVDVADAGAVRATVAEAIDRHGAPRVLVNNAGINIDRPFLQMSDEE